MIRARILQGKVTAQEPIPEAWEGQMVKIMLLSPDDALPDLDRRLEDLHGMGQMEFEEGEQERIEKVLEEFNRLSKGAMGQILGGQG